MSDIIEFYKNKIRKDCYSCETILGNHAFFYWNMVHGSMRTIHSCFGSIWIAREGMSIDSSSYSLYH